MLREIATKLTRYLFYESSGGKSKFLSNQQRNNFFATWMLIELMRCQWTSPAQWCTLSCLLLASTVRLSCRLFLIAFNCHRLPELNVKRPNRAQWSHNNSAIKTERKERAFVKWLSFVAGSSWLRLHNSRKCSQTVIECTRCMRIFELRWLPETTLLSRHAMLENVNSLYPSEFLSRTSIIIIGEWETSFFASVISKWSSRTIYTRWNASNTMLDCDLWLASWSTPLYPILSFQCQCLLVASTVNWLQSRGEKKIC